MKVIDIFNKIANKEEVPKKVKFNYKTYTYKPEWDDYADEEEICRFLVDVISSSYQITRMLNEKIEIIEEDKKIEDLKDGDFTDHDMLVQLVCKVKQLISEVNKLKEK